MGLDTVELVWKIEKQFSIRITNYEASQISTVQDFYDVVAKHLLTNNRIVADFKNTINEIIADQAGIELHEILPHKSITSDFGLD